jgi:CRISPR type III-A-associated protein Csm2
MSNGKTKHPRKTIRDVEDFQKFRKAMVEGFVIKEDGVAITNPILLDLSQGVAKALYKGTGFWQREDTVTQFRKFFNEVRGLKALVNSPSKLGVELRMLRARMGYAAGRQTISEDFSTVINDCIDTMMTLGDFKTQIQGFCDVFESLYAYYYYHKKGR